MASKESLILEIAQIALGVLAGVLPGASAAISIAEAAIQIEQKAQQAYVLETGQPMNPDLIQPETPIP